MTAPVPWIQSPAPWGTPLGTAVQSETAPLPTGAHPSIRPITDDAQVRYCKRHVTGPMQGFCVSACKVLHANYPTSPDGKFYAWGPPDGGVVVGRIFCTNPAFDPKEDLRDRRFTAEDAPDWTRPLELLSPVGFTVTAIGTAALPPPGPTQAEELRRATAAVPPPTIPDLPKLLAGLPPEAAAALLKVVQGQQVDVAALVAVLVQGLGLVDRIRAALQEVAPQITGEVTPSLTALSERLEAVSPGLVQGLRPALDALSRSYSTAAAESAQLALATDQVEGEKDRGALAGLASGVWDAAGNAVEPLVKKAVAVFQTVFAFLGDKVQDLGELLVAQIGTVYRDALEARAPITTATVGDVAAVALRNALAAGLAAQTAALILELAHPLKRLGLNQVVAFVADFAGFGQVAGAFTGPSLRHGLQVPADHRAASVFRTRLPGPGEAQEQAFQRHISPGDYAQILALHGYPSWWIQVLVDDLYVDPRPRELSQLLEDSEADPAWLALKLREVWWDDSDVEKGVNALLLRSTQPGRSRVISAAMREYANGRLTEAELDRHLSAAALREEHKALWLRAARLERRGDLMESLGTRIVRQYRDEVSTREAADQELTGLGFTPDEVRARLLAADLDRQVTQLREDTQEVEGHIREIRTAALANLRQQFRAGFVTRLQLLTWGEALGFATAYLENVAVLETLKGPPSKVETLPVMGLGAVQEATAEYARLLKDEVRGGRVLAAQAVELLAGFGVPREIARDLFRVQEILALPTPGTLRIPVPDGRGGRLGWEAVLGEIMDEIRRGRANRQLVREVSAVLGIPVTHTAGREPWWAVLDDVIRGR